ncbi:MAG: fatty acid-CoA racemase [Phenylobacterium sp.]|nr:fatty acid-CoA racemase [Phenylobacterium sp.]
MLLQGYKVVELGTYIAAPAAAATLGRWGAEVIKIEGLEGDPIRWVRPIYRPDIPPNFELDNYGKRSIALDFAKPEGREIVLDLVRDADVFVTSFRASSLAKAGFDFDSLHALNPKLVYGSVSGYGLQGPGADKNAFDLTAFWSRSGLALQSFPPDAMPSNVRPGIGDHLTALTLTLGVVTALLEREKTGVGRLVETSLLANGLYVGSYDLIEHMRRGEGLPNQSRAAADSTPFYRSGDGRWFAFFPNHPQRDWPAIFAAANVPELAHDARFNTVEGRRDNGQAMKAALDAGFASRPMAEIAESLTASGITWSGLANLPEVLADPYVEAVGALIDVDDGEGGVLPTPGPPIRFPGVELGVAGLVPTIGQHTDEVLRELGRDAATIAGLKAARVVR